MGMTKEAQDLVNRAFGIAERLIAAYETDVTTRRLAQQHHERLTPAPAKYPPFGTASP